MSRKLIATEKIRHNGINYPIGSEVRGLTDKDSDRLIRLKSGKWVEAEKELQEVIAQDAAPVEYTDPKPDESRVQTEPQAEPEVVDVLDEPKKEDEELETTEDLDLSLSSGDDADKPVTKGKAGKK